MIISVTSLNFDSDKRLLLIILFYLNFQWILMKECRLETVFKMFKTNASRRLTFLSLVMCNERSMPKHLLMRDSHF